MAEVWVKSSYSEDGGNNCVEIAVIPDGIAIRDSVRPEHVIRLHASAFVALLLSVQRETTDAIPR
ncbi:DUF397 domain-containing protein [Streptomyces sp. NPDC048606]|uniref:DUF397 domain-containing protein n=1 Tax=Streptomyces sp. NPDC048606 TaxID=3154726 RepID=UPI00343D3911